MGDLIWRRWFSCVLSIPFREFFRVCARNPKTFLLMPLAPATLWIISKSKTFRWKQVVWSSWWSEFGIHACLGTTFCMFWRNYSEIQVKALKIICSRLRRLQTLNSNFVRHTHLKCSVFQGTTVPNLAFVRVVIPVCSFAITTDASLKFFAHVFGARFPTTSFLVVDEHAKLYLSQGKFVELAVCSLLQRFRSNLGPLDIH